MIDWRETGILHGSSDDEEDEDDDDEGYGASAAPVARATSAQKQQQLQQVRWMGDAANPGGFQAVAILPPRLLMSVFLHC